MLQQEVDVHRKVDVAAVLQVVVHQAMEEVHQAEVPRDAVNHQTAGVIPIAMAEDQQPAVQVAAVMAEEAIAIVDVHATATAAQGN